MTNEEAEEMLKALTEHYKEAVMPASKYCKALETWADIVSKQGSFNNSSIDGIRLTLDKSGLAHRLIYKGEELRNRECPNHKGRMHTQLWCFGTVCICEGSGWLPNKIEQGCAICTKEVQYFGHCPCKGCDFTISYCNEHSNIERIKDEYVAHFQNSHTTEDRIRNSFFESRPLFDNTGSYSISIDNWVKYWKNW
jgi:hypothetical protein